MRVFVYGTSTVEHAVLWRLAASSRIAGLFCADDGPSQLGLAKLLGGGRKDPAELREACVSQKVDVAVLNSRTEDAEKLTSELRREGIGVIAPGEETRELEDDPSWLHSFADRNGIATVERNNTELTVFALTDGRSYRVLASSQRHDYGNRNGQPGSLETAGALAPVPWIDSSFNTRIEDEIVHRTFQRLFESGLPHTGVVGFGVGRNENGPALSSVRFSFAEPEVAVLMPLLEMDFGALLEALVEQKLDSVPFRMSNRSALAFVLTNRSNASTHLSTSSLALPGYSGENYTVFLSADVETGGHVSIRPGATVTAVGLGKDPLQARQRALALAGELAQTGLSFRKDVGSNLFA